MGWLLLGIAMSIAVIGMTIEVLKIENDRFIRTISLLMMGLAVIWIILLFMLTIRDLRSNGDQETVENCEHITLNGVEYIPVDCVEIK